MNLFNRNSSEDVPLTPIIAAIVLTAVSIFIAIAWFHSHLSTSSWQWWSADKWQYTVRSGAGVIEWREYPARDATSAFEGRSRRFVDIPYRWIIAVPAAGAAALWLVCFRNAHMRNQATERMMLGLCQNCGYDLRESTDRCPECGQSSPRAPN